MGNVTVKNCTDLTDFSAVIRAGMYLAGQTSTAEAGGYRFERKDTLTGTTVRIMLPEEKEPAGMTVPESST